MGNSVMDLIYAMFNQYLFIEAKNNIDTIKYYFDTNSNTAGNPLVDQLLGAIKNYDLASIDVPLFQSILMRSGKGQDEAQGILNEIFKWKRYSKDQIEPVRKTLQDVCASVILRKAGNLYSDSPSEYIKYIKNLNFQTADPDILKATAFNKIDINSVVAGSTEGIESKYSWVNNSFRPLNKVPLGQIILFSGAPGTGKSLWALNECLYYASQGYRGHYLMLGDLNISDVVERSCSIFSGLSFAETRMNMGPIYNEMCKSIGDRLSFSCIPAQRITIDEYIDFIDSIDEELVKKGEEKLKFCCIDYDAGFLGSGSDDNESNLYQSLGNLYGKITELSIARGKLVIVLSQPNRGSLNLEEIGLDQIGESLRKIQIVDMVITRGRWTGNDNGLGIFRIVKNRHGSYSRSWNIRIGGNFIDIPKGLYERLKEVQDQRDYTIGEIKMMARQYEMEQDALKQQLASIGNGNHQQPRKPIETPFGKI